jgi:hypothetical protein
MLAEKRAQGDVAQFRLPDSEIDASLLPHVAMFGCNPTELTRDYRRHANK